MSQLKPLAPVGMLSPLYSDEQVKKLGRAMFIETTIGYENIALLLEHPKKFLAGWWLPSHPTVLIKLVQIIVETGVLIPYEDELHGNFSDIAPSTQDKLIDIFVLKAKQARRLLAAHEGGKIAA